MPQARCALLLIFVALVACLNAGPPSASAENAFLATWCSDMDTAWQKARATRRPLVLVATSDDCLFCEELKHKTLGDPAVQSEIEQSFVVAAIKASEEPSLMQRLKIVSFPTTVVISPEGRVLAIIHGCVPPAKFRARLASVSRDYPR